MIRSCFIAATVLLVGMAMGAYSPLSGTTAREQLTTIMTTLSNDSIPLPPKRVESFSPNREFVLLVESLNGWESPVAIAKFFHLTSSGQTLLWESRLPQEYGPRFALVGDGGQVLLLDEWINIESKNAIWLRTLHTAISYDFNAVVGLLNLPPRDIVRRAAVGWWISGTPSLAEAGTAAIVPAAGKRILINLDSGQLSLLE